jgi:hypothetical protein
MPLESATYISQLVPSNPSATDPTQQGQNHLALIKQVLQNQFPDLGAAAVTATAAELNSAAGAFGTAGTLEVLNNGTVAGAELKLDGISGTGTLAAAQPVVFMNAGTVAGPSLLEILMAGTAGTLAPVVTLDATGDLTATGTLAGSALVQAGNPALPPGIICMWSGSVAGIPGGWALCNGATVNGYTTPDLRSRFIMGAGSTYVPGQTGGAASVTAATDSQGAHSHTGATGAAGGHTPTGTTDSQGSHNHGGADGAVALTIAQMPAHSHTFQTQDRGSSTQNGVANDDAGASGSPASTDSQGGGQTHQHSISTDGAHSHNLSMNAVSPHTHSISVDGSHAHNVTVATLPPFYALAFVMKVS